jgi:hypothetical protein
MEVLGYCQELDPVATRLRDTLSQYMQFLRVPSLAPKPKAPATWTPAALKKPPSETLRRERQQQAPPQNPDLVDLLLSTPTGHAGPIQTSSDLLELACQPFNNDNDADDDSDRDRPRSGRPSTATTANGSVKAYRVPHVLGDVRHDHSAATPARDKWGRQACDDWMPFGWQQCQSSTAFTGKSTTFALTMAQQEMMRAGV